MSFGKYVTCKDSGIEWLGSVPSHWDIAPLKAVASCNDEVLPESTDSEAVIEYVEISGVEEGKGITQTETLAFGAAPSRARRVVRHGDVLISTVRTYLRAIATVKSPPDNLVASTGFAAIRPRSVDAGFLGYLLHAEYLLSEVVARSVGISYPAINASELMRLKAPIPSLQEQRAISDFLSRETAKIDALVEEQKRLIELLKEKRQAVISEAVTKGLNPNVPMKDSGVEWLGKIPAHWNVLPCRAIVFEKTARNDGAACGDYLSLMANVGVIPYADKGDVGNKAPEDLSKCKLVAAGDIVINSMNYGIGSFGLSDLSGVCSPVYVVLRPFNEVVETRFAFRIFAHRTFQTYAQSFGNGILAHRAAIGWDTLKSIGVPVPPLDEQLEILNYLDASTAKFEALVSEAEAGVQLLQERRAALISAAVTGKIDVQGLRGPADLRRREIYE